MNEFILITESEEVVDNMTEFIMTTEEDKADNEDNLVEFILLNE